tara:strand:- start:523 stop:1356 length:834 start_codon:yes stop_codon:yes gene_type:complete
MSIKQNGGVFGRNPTFNDVTIEGQLTFDGDIDVNSDLKVDGNLDVTGTGDFGGKVKVTTAGNGEIDVARTGGALINLQAQSARGVIGTNSNHELQLKTNGGGRLKITTSGNVEVMSGNLVIGTSGKGIDFSATAGTGTSELFSDYEEGTFTPTYTGSTSNPTITYDMQYGIYVKVGRLCHVVCRIRTDATSGGSGNLLLSGLPFNAFAAPTSSMSGGITVNRADSFTTNTPTYGVISNGNSYINLNYDIAASAVTTANLTNAVNSNTLIISLVYQTA